MEITQSTVPGVGTLHHCESRDGSHLAILIDHSNLRQLMVYATEPDGVASDEPVALIALGDDEADAIADLLHSRSIPDRIAELERRLAELPTNPV
jgi:TrkA domain protein